MKYNIEIEAFKGPFDLLFHLIEKNKIDIYDIPISEIVNQYIDYLYRMESLNLEIASEFLVMAASLIQIKSKLLLPSEKLEHEEVKPEEIDDPRDELVKKLLEYKKYKIAASKLKEREKSYKKLYFKTKEELIVNQSDGDIIPENLNAIDLLKTFEKVISNKFKNKIFNNDEIVDLIYRESITIEGQTKEIISRLKIHDSIDFNKEFIESSSKLNIIISFLAVLELIKTKQIRISQKKDMDNIIIIRI